MNRSPSDLAAALVHCQAGIASILQQTDSRPELARAFADLLGETVPQAVCTACLLSGAGAIQLAVRSSSDRSTAEMESLFQTQLSPLSPLAADVQRLPTETMPNIQLLASAIHADERPRGFLVIGLPTEANPEDTARATALLTVAAPAVALRWQLVMLQGEQAELARFALVGQAFIGLTHELNNALNSMMLQTSVVQLRVDEQARRELAAIRQHGAQAAGLVRSLQHVAQERREKFYSVDLNSMLIAVLEEEPTLSTRVSLRLTPNVPPIQSNRSAVKQLVRLLLEGVCAATEAAVIAETGEQDGGSVLSLTLAGTEGGESAIESLLWQNLDEVGRLAGQSLLRQLGGTLTAEQTGDRLILHVLWKQPS